MNTEQLNAIKKRAEKATPGPWKSGEQYEQMEPGYYVASEANGLIVLAEEEGILRKDDVDFIANARQDVPALIAEVEHLVSAIIYACEMISIGESRKANDKLTEALGIPYDYFEEDDE